MNKNIIEPNTYQLLLQLNKEEYLKDFYLVGGTALTLQIEHRFSLDLDFFNENHFNPQNIINYLQEQKYNFIILYQAKNTLSLIINNIKVEFLTHPYNLVNPLILNNNLTLASVLDIAAMKINAIINSGERWKDFIDIYFILEHYSLDDILIAFKNKYQQTNVSVALKSLTYFDEIKDLQSKFYISKKLSLALVKKRMLASLINKNKVFTPN
ncbi:MAG: nucleotidyl transferase AbiEii/AbiGii toxin family protein [Alphaproteobacteria bacterium]|nr:nucleotidyl transferase AbiEii/AbiGii toxin family protein [Alphaproteobacteria bacterium]